VLISLAEQINLDIRAGESCHNFHYIFYESQRNTLLVQQGAIHNHRPAVSKNSVPSPAYLARRLSILAFLKTYTIYKSHCVQTEMYRSAGATIAHPGSGSRQLGPANDKAEPLTIVAFCGASNSRKLGHPWQFLSLPKDKCACV
jgi:hypothetical protein